MTGRGGEREAWLVRARRPARAYNKRGRCDTDTSRDTRCGVEAPAPRCMRQSASANTTCAHAPRTTQDDHRKCCVPSSGIYLQAGGDLPFTTLANYFIAMLATKVIQLVLAAAVVWRESDAGTSTAVKLCGRQLSEIMSRVCHAYNSPSWDVPTVVEQPGTVARRKRQLGIVDECCVIGCTWEQLSEYCSISAYSESPFDLEGHNIADRSAEVGAKSAKPEAPVRQEQAAPSVPAEMKERERRREVGGARARGYGRGRRARCWCRRKRRTGRRRNTIMGTRKKCSRCPGGRHRISPNNMGQNSQH